MNVLSIDAWGNLEEGYEWNAWYKVGEITKEEFERVDREEGFIQWFIENNYVWDDPQWLEIEDDQYNIVIKDKETQEPLFAIEYGCHY